MDKFISHTGVAAPLLRINVDTDAIIPSREMKRVSKEGLGEGLFAGWRYLAQGARDPNPEFVLNKPDYAGASIILSGDNFGCGSSREHAVWALKEYGIRAIIAPGFGAIFANNCIRNGLLPIVLPDEAVKALAASVEKDPQTNKIHIDLEKKQVTGPGGKVYDFNIEDGPRDMLLQGLDVIGLTLRHKADIDAFKAKDRLARPWIYLERGG